MLAAVRALGNQLEAAKAVDADEASRELGGPQPGLATSRAVRTSEGTLARILRLGRIAQAAFDSFGHLTRVASG